MTLHVTLEGLESIAGGNGFVFTCCRVPARRDKERFWQRFLSSFLLLFEEISVMAEEDTIKLRHRFSDVTNSQLADIVDAAQPKSTKDATKFWIGVLFKFCQERNLEFDLDSCSASDLNEILQLFYAGLRTKTGGVYKRASYLAVRAAVQRELQARRRSFNIFTDHAFKQSNVVLDGVLKKNKK